MKSVSRSLKVLQNYNRFQASYEYRFYSVNVSALKEEFDQFSTNYSTSTQSTNYRIYSFGLTEHGALGLMNDNGTSRQKKYITRPVRHFFAEENCVTDVACGFGFTAFAVNSKDTFKVYGCGINTDNQISGENYELLLTPYPINIGLQNPDAKVSSLSAGRAHLAVATDCEGIFVLGSNCYGQCGRPIVEEEKADGVFSVNCIKELDGEKIKQVFCGQDHTFFLTSSGRVYSCGWGADGQTGQGHTGNVCNPTRVKGDIETENIVKLAGCSDTVLAVNAEGGVFGWGSSEYLQLSPAKEIRQVNSPIALKHVSDLGVIKDVAAGGSFCMALTETGEVYVWGYGILGGGPQLQKSNIPIPLPKTLFGCNEFAPDTKVKAIYCGLSHMVVINSSCHLYSWGRNRFGCLGIGHIRDQYFPYKVALGALAVKASCGVDHTMVVSKPF